MLVLGKGPRFISPLSGGRGVQVTAAARGPGRQEEPTPACLPALGLDSVFSVFPINQVKLGFGVRE